MPATPTETTAIRLARVRGRPHLTVRGGAYRGMPVEWGAHGGTVALLAERALLLEGDHVALRVEVADGLTLHLRETAGTVAYDMRGGCASWSLHAHVAAGATLVVDAPPWVSAEGSRTVRSTEVDLEPEARLAVRETLVLGRTGEDPGRLVSHTRVSREGRVQLVEELDAVHVAPHRVLDTVLCFGAPADAWGGEAPAVPGGPLRLESGDLVWRALAHDAHEAARLLDPVWDVVRTAQASRVTPPETLASASRVGTTKR